MAARRQERFRSAIHSSKDSMNVLSSSVNASRILPESFIMCSGILPDSFTKTSGIFPGFFLLEFSENPYGFPWETFHDSVAFFSPFFLDTSGILLGSFGYLFKIL